MSTVAAIYENGVFRPTERIDLPDRCSVELEVRMRDNGETQPAVEPQPEAKVRRIEEKIAEIAADVPAEVWDSLPTDLSEQLDHYLYGTPKR